MVLCGHGDPYRKGTEYTVRGFGQSGRDIAAMRLNKPVNDEPWWLNVLFGFTVAGMTFWMLFIVWDQLKDVYQVLLRG